MKSRKNSHSLSKLHLKKNEYHGNSQRSLHKKYPKRSNQSHIQRFGTETPLQHHQAVRNQYYGTVQHGIYRSENDSMIQKPSKKIKMGKMMHDIEQKMKRVLQNSQFDSQIDIPNVVLQQEDVDEEFEQKILQNKHLLKQQRQKHDFTHSQFNHDTQTKLKDDNKKIKKLSLIQGKNEKIAQKLKSKSLLPVINSVTSKLFEIYQQKQREGKQQQKNQTQRKNMKLQNIYLLPQLRHKNSQKQQHSNHEPKSIQSRLVLKNSLQINTNSLQQKKLADLHKQLSNKKSTELKLQSKIQELKSKIAQRTTNNHQRNNKLQSNIQNISQKQKVQRYSSHSVFDSIQQFLSNPHQNSKSQRKLLKLYQKINDDDGVMQKEKKSLKKKIQAIKNKIKDIEQNPNEIIDQKINKMQEQKIQIPTSTGSDEIQDGNGSMIWRRMQGNKIKKSNFENEIKYVKSLEEKGRSNLADYIENQKILHELKMIKKPNKCQTKMGGK